MAMSYEDVLEYLYGQLPMFHRIGPAAYKPGLDTTIALCQLVGNPQDDLKCVHVAGTNGKGSTSHLIASALQEGGYTTGLCTSPHLFDFRERIKINGSPISKEAIVQFVETFKEAWTPIAPSFFEITIALCFWYFNKEKVDIAVIETGLGGRLDSTNVITPEVSVITNIGFDHMNLLGDTLEKIAGEKAGIIKTNIPVVLGPMRSEVYGVFREKAKQTCSAITETSLQQEVPATELKGIYQEENRRTAWNTLRILRQKKGWVLSDEQIQQGFLHVIKNTGIAGRWQQLGTHPLIIVDVAHNEDGLNAVVQQIQSTPHDHLHFVLGMVNDKDISKVLSLLPQDATYYFCKANIPRGLDAHELAKQAAICGLQGDVYESVNSAYKAALEKANFNDLVFIGGSFFTVAEIPING